MSEPVKKRGPGRPAKGGRQYNVKLTDEVAEFYRARGGPKRELTAGIERVATERAKRARSRP